MDRSVLRIGLSVLLGWVRLLCCIDASLAAHRRVIRFAGGECECSRVH